MENASKALIIAGAILLSILIISLGIMVFQNAKNTVGNASLNKQEIETFNSEWTTYEGTNKTASEVKAMIQAVNASNSAESRNGSNRFIKITNTGTASTTVETTAPASTATSGVSNNATYTIKLGYNNGYVVGIDYKANSNS